MDVKAMSCEICFGQKSKIYSFVYENKSKEHENKFIYNRKMSRCSKLVVQSSMQYDHYMLPFDGMHTLTHGHWKTHTQSIE